MARKLLRPFGDLSEDDIRDELHATSEISKIQHPNIVEILDHGNLNWGDYYFIDMELCDLGLHQYIHGDPPTGYTTNMAFVPADWSCKLKQINVAIIIMHVAQGLQFIHEADLTHRDLKPQNGDLSSSSYSLTLVLFSKKRQMWKITDFGLSTYATSKKAVTTRYSRGTTGYRAPELLEEKPTFNNKVDIWALGCIFYELITGSKAFHDDWIARAPINLPSFRDVSCPHGTCPHYIDLYPHFDSCLLEMLMRNPKERPRAAGLCSIFQSYNIILGDTQIKMLGQAPLQVEYSEWKDLVIASWQKIRSQNYPMPASYHECTTATSKAIRGLRSTTSDFNKCLYSGGANTTARYHHATKILGEIIKFYEPRWGSLDFPELQGEPKNFSDSLFSKITEKMDSPGAILKDKDGWEKCMRLVRCAFATFGHFGKYFRIITENCQLVFAIPCLSQQ